MDGGVTIANDEGLRWLRKAIVMKEGTEDMDQDLEACFQLPKVMLIGTRIGEVLSIC